MSDSTEMKLLHSQVLFLKVQKKSTEELISIWVENDDTEWDNDEFDTIHKVLLERLDKLPEQKIKQRKKDIQPYKNGIDFKDILGDIFYHPIPWRFRAIFIIICMSILCIGVVMALVVDQNSKLFWNFVENVTKSDIQKIEIQRIGQFSKGIGEVITIDDRENISEFVSAIKTIQGYETNHPRLNYKVRIKIWLTKKHKYELQPTVEFKCYTTKYEGNTLFVDGIWLNPKLYGFVNGNAKFVEPDLIYWMEKNGISIKK